MALPKIQLTKHTLTLPYSKKEVEYRPFIVAEEKMLLTALESGDEKEKRSAVLQCIDACTFGSIDSNTTAMIDIEYLFLHLRIKSKGKLVDYSYKCKECGVENTKQLDLEEVKVINEDVDNVIKITSDIGIKMKAPTYELADKISNKMTVEDIFNTIVASIDLIYEGDTVFKAKDYDEEELHEFIGSLSEEHFNKIKEYFENMPQLALDVDVSCAACEHKDNTTLKGLTNFLA